MQFTIGNHTSIGKVRTANEDAFGNWMTPNGHLFIVCDGMGGHIGGAIASQAAVSAIYQTIASQRFPSADLAISQGLSHANTQLRRLVQEKPDLNNMGTTAVVVLLQDDRAYLGHIGDSRIYLYRKRQLHRLTKDHSFVQSLVDQGHITDQEAERHPRKNEIYRAIGIEDSISPTVPTQPIQIQAGDTLLLCTDGLNGMIGDRGISAVLANEAFSAQQAAEALIADADNAGGHDNATVQILRWPAAPAVVPPPVVTAQRPAPEPVLRTAPPVASPQPKEPVTPPVSKNVSQPPLSIIEDSEPVSRRRPSIGLIVGGIALLGALAFIGWSNFRNDPQPKLGMDAVSTTDTVPTSTTPVPDNPAPEDTARSPAPPATGTLPTTAPKTQKPASTSRPDTGAKKAVTTPAAASKPRTDTVRKAAPPKAPAPAATKPTTPASSSGKPTTSPKPTPTATPAAKPPAPARKDTGVRRQPKAVLNGSSTP